MNKIKKFYILIPVLTALFSLGMIIYTSSLNNHPKQEYTIFLQDLETNKIQNVIIDSSSKMTVKLKDGKTYITDNPNKEDLKETLLLKNIKISDETNPPLIKTIPSGILVLSILTIIAMLLVKARHGSSSVTSMDIVDFSKNIGINFSSVAGNEEAKESLMDIIDFLKNPEKYEKYGARMPKGIILYGEPGTGKTLLAKAVAGEANVPFYALSGSDFVQVYVGVGAARVRSLFKKAKSKGKAVIFIDEIDAIGKARSNNESSSTNSERDQTLNALLTEMSGFGEGEGIIVIAATNKI